MGHQNNEDFGPKRHSLPSRVSWTRGVLATHQVKSGIRNPPHWGTMVGLSEKPPHWVEVTSKQDIIEVHTQRSSQHPQKESYPGDKQRPVQRLHLLDTNHVTPLEVDIKIN